MPERRGDLRVIAGSSRLQRRRTVCIRGIRVGAMSQQEIDRVTAASLRRQQQRSSAVGVAGIDVDLLLEQRLHSRRVADLGRLPQRLGRVRAARCREGRGGYRCPRRIRLRGNIDP